MNIPATMTAAVYHGRSDVRIERRNVPEPARDEVLVRVLRSGICGTDASEWRAGPILFPEDGAHILGHEFVGEVVRSDSTEFPVGVVVASGAGVSCGNCARCREGRTNLCVNYYTLGLNAPGALAEFVAVPVSTLVRVPDGLDIDHAGLAQPLAVGLHAARRAGVRDGDRVVLIGAGAIGTFVLAGLTHLNHADVTVVDFPGTRLNRAVKLGAARIVEAGGDVAADVQAAVASPIDVVIEASGAPGQLAVAIGLVRPGGTVLQVGLPHGPQEVDVHSLVLREVALLGTLAHVCGEDLGPALEILRSTALGAQLLDSVHPLDDLADQLERLSRGRVDGKVLFDPTIPNATKGVR